MQRSDLKPLAFVGSSRQDLRDFPEEVRGAIGHALKEVQLGLTPLAAKPLKGFGGATVMEIVDDYATDTYRAVYTIRFAGIVYVLHAFQKKSKQRRATTQRDIDLIKHRLLQAQADYKKRQHERNDEHGT